MDQSQITLTNKCSGNTPGITSYPIINQKLLSQNREVLNVLSVLNTPNLYTELFVPVSVLTCKYQAGKDKTPKYCGLDAATYISCTLDLQYYYSELYREYKLSSENLHTTTF